MIRLIIGNVGSGKTAMAVRDIVLSRLPIHSNIETTHIPHNTLIQKEHIFKKELVRVKKTGEEVFKTVLNEEYWKELKTKKPAISVYIDEAHTLLNPRRSMSETNKVMGDFLALLRRIVGSTESGYGELVLITQLERRLDVIAKEMATLVQYCICHYMKKCKKCGYACYENNEEPEKVERCPRCKSYAIDRDNFIIEVRNFKNIDDFHMWFEYGSKTFYKKWYITDIHKIFPLYNTHQWESLLSD